MTDRRPPALELDPDRSSDGRADSAGAPRNEATDPPFWTVVDLDAAAADLGAPAEGDDRQRAARSLFQTATLGAVLTNLAAGSSMENEQPDEPVTIQGLRGECGLAVGTERVAVRQGMLVAIPAGIAWRLDATSDATVLTTVTRPRR